ncbi:hypothetical protein SAMN06265379_103301 [Saccharicrinis carchari]|uniref:Outer membrane protein beta-barrel domain-containing protein n=1 Tax=Saccharicrinis carchari TaxID=1168039 RepID=A0A521CPJ8_SACCC|nr:hypothetical protein [Saccharicrinis carchari]SMO60691.1 hypothetical protein SAMN06265379_103301 [Saccharicrinis carchari]
MNSKIGLKLLVVVICLTFTSPIYAQEADHNHHHHQYELGLANSAVYFPKEKETAYGLHLHLIRNIKHSKLGFGLAYERIFDEHRHNTIGLVGSYNLFESMHISLSPGITFEDNEMSALRFAFHAEAAYGFNLGHLHLGPMLEFAFDPEHYHISVGLHVGYGF